MAGQLRIAFILKKPECSIGCMYIAAAVKSEAECRVFIHAYEEDLCESVCKYNPDIIAFPTFTGEHKNLLAINNEIKKRVKVLSIFGGPHPTYHPDFIKEQGVDIICRGEGELAVLELVRALKKGDNYHGIQNLYFKTDKGEIIQNELRDLVEDIDNLAFPDRNIYSHYFHIEGFKNNIVKRVISGRGCPYNCSYCYNHALKKIYENKGKYVRIRSVKNVIDELVWLKETYNPTDFSFVDDIFGIKPEWSDEFGGRYKKLVNIPFSCLSHVNFINENYVSSLREAGCKLVCLGIETGNESVRRDLLRREYSNDRIYKATDILRKYNIPFYAFNILLLPGENLKLALETLKVNMKCRTFLSDALIFQPFPGTELSAYSARNKYHEEKLEEIPDNLFVDSVLKNPEKKTLMRLFYLFQLTAKFRYLYPLTRILIRLPLDKLYKKIHKCFKDETRKYHVFDLAKIEQKITFFGFLRTLLQFNKADNYLSISATK